MFVHRENVDHLYEMLKSRVKTRKKEFDRFIEFLEKQTSWLTSPASTRYHLNKEKGLLIHSVGVTYQLLKLKQAWLPQLDDESCIICGLFHDVGKLGTPGRPLYIKGKEGYLYNPEVVSMGLGVRSLFLVSQFIRLSDDEAQAICYHDGQYVSENRAVAHRERPMTLLLHYADYWTAHMYEDERMRREFNLSDEGSEGDMDNAPGDRTNCHACCGSTGKRIGIPMRK